MFPCRAHTWHAAWHKNRAVSGHITGYTVNDALIEAKMLKILCRAQNVVYNVVSISGYELVGYFQKGIKTMPANSFVFTRAPLY